MKVTLVGRGASLDLVSLGPDLGSDLLSEAPEWSLSLHMSRNRSLVSSNIACQRHLVSKKHWDKQHLLSFLRIAPASRPAPIGKDADVTATRVFARVLVDMYERYTMRGTWEGWRGWQQPATMVARCFGGKTGQCCCPRHHALSSEDSADLSVV
ncbi:hypothetical protein T440DRAFT_136479 [Plenodomus tracheiphilus IPT5]|uniref:Uncharacterized protein n=1 Tax=Plenodomus tracheiphilus IPT5 TaxID=1408161 RepID=A0A6A7B2L2_9PLEO|nr:hypothetical protein T440DRAFT_136479 [Plenodomus tracheiphilus IPT5]